MYNLSQKVSTKSWARLIFHGSFMFGIIIIGVIRENNKLQHIGNLNETSSHKISCC